MVRGDAETRGAGAAAGRRNRLGLAGRWLLAVCAAGGIAGCSAYVETRKASPDRLQAPTIGAFDAPQAGTDLATLHYIATLASLSYESRDRLRVYLGRFPNLKIVKDVRDEKEIGRFVLLEDAGTSPHSFLIVIRGTANVRDALKDAEAFGNLDTDADIVFHSGFQTRALTIFNQVDDAVGKTARVTIVGHSLGGGTAVLLGMLFVVDRQPAGATGKNPKTGEDTVPGNPTPGIHVYTFGQPRAVAAAKLLSVVTKPGFAYLDLIRVVNRCDIVTHVPLNVIADASKVFFHFGHQIYLLDDSNWSMVPAPKSDEFIKFVGNNRSIRAYPPPPAPKHPGPDEASDEDNDGSSDAKQKAQFLKSLEPVNTREFRETFRGREVLDPYSGNGVFYDPFQLFAADWWLDADDTESGFGNHSDALVFDEHGKIKGAKKKFGYMARLEALLKANPPPLTGVYPKCQ